MFTGLITDIGVVRALIPLSASADQRIEIATAWDVGPIAEGASIACDGCCLTVVAKGEGVLAFLLRPWVWPAAGDALILVASGAKVRLACGA